MSARVYAELVARTGALAAEGGTVIADAVFARPGERAAIAAAAAGAGARFLGVWLEVDPATLRARVAARRGGVSDATAAVFERQLGYDHGPIDWLRLDAGPPPDAVAGTIRRHLPGARLGLIDPSG